MPRNTWPVSSGSNRRSPIIRSILRDEHVDAVLIAVGHNLHAKFVCETLAAGKHAFVEKPLAMNVEEVSQVIEAARKRWIAT